jgi:hypothetical protein
MSRNRGVEKDKRELSTVGTRAKALNLQGHGNSFRPRSTNHSRREGPVLSWKTEFSLELQALVTPVSYYSLYTWSQAKEKTKRFLVCSATALVVARDIRRKRMQTGGVNRACFASRTLVWVSHLQVPGSTDATAGEIEVLTRLDSFCCGRVEPLFAVREWSQESGQTVV